MPRCPFRKRKQARRGGRSKSRTRLFRPLWLELLEDRHLLAVFTPTTVAGLIADINTANGNGQADTIDLGGRMFTLTAADNEDNGLPIISADGGNGLTIENGTIERDTAASTPQFRILEVADGGDLTINLATIRGGDPSGRRGGGVYTSSGTINVNDSTISGNAAGFFDGGYSTGRGGAIYTHSGAVTIAGSTISGNTAGSHAGIYTYAGFVNVTNSTISNNSSGFRGGGIGAYYGDVSISGSTISGNSSGDGGGIYTGYGDVSVMDSTISRNSGGGIQTSGGIISVVDSAITDNSNQHNGGGIYTSSGAVNVTNSTIADNSSEFNGGGIYTRSGMVSITDSRIVGNSAGSDGGGVRTFTGSVTVTGSDISGNAAASALSDGGGIDTFSGNVNVMASTIADNLAGLSGGGVNTESGEVIVISSTISGNVAAGGFGSYTGRGGGIRTISGTVNITASTISGNSATDPLGRGGGIYSYSGDVGIIGSTISGNTAGRDGGGIFVDDTSYDGHVVIGNSIVAGNVAGTGNDFVRDPDDSPTVTTSLLGDNSGSGLTAAPVGLPDADGNLIGTASIPIDALLGPLNYNGGPTQTHALLLGSPAIDQGNANGQTTDQRGFLRTFDQSDINDGAAGPTDMGAFEVGLVVTTADDELDADISDPTDLSVREAIDFANNNPGGFDITFVPSLAGMPINLTMGQLSLTGAVAIRGLGANQTTIDAQGNSRVVDVGGGSFGVTLNGLTLTGGQTLGTTEDGGGIRFGFSGSDNTGMLHVSSSTISGNTAGYALGGGIYSSSGSVSVTGSTISGNSADRFGGGIRTSSGSVSVTSSTISGNSATGQLGLAGGGISTVTGSVSITSSTISGNSAAFIGGGISTVYGSVSVTSSTISGNSAAGYGGGISTVHGSVSVTSSTISGNSADGNGGGIRTSSGSVSVTSSTISGNSADGNGGGIRTSSGSVSVTSSTISGNSAADHGGGIYLFNGPATIRSSIISGNSDNGTAPDIEDNSNTVTISNSLVGDNTGSELTEAQTPDGNGNLIGTNASPIDPKLGPLDFNGGTTQTHALLPGSPAIDQGDVNGQTTDQRGFLRTFDQPDIADGGAGPTDMGAFELGLIVTTADDELDGDISDSADLSLREAIQFANDNEGGHDIALDLALAGMAINLTLGQISISDQVAIRGLGANRSTIDAQGNSRIFNVEADSFDVTINGLTLTGGQTPDSEDGGAVRFGSAGAENTGTLRVSSSTISGNAADGSGGGIYASTGGVNVTRSTIAVNSAGGDGGGVATSSGPVRVTESSISRNVSARNGGGIATYSGSVSVTGSAIIRNTSGFGGGIATDSGEVGITGSTISGNSSTYQSDGGAISMFSTTASGSGSTIAGNATGDGGGIATGSGALSLTRSTVARNTADGNGGGIFVYDSSVNAHVAIASSIIAGNTAAGAGNDFVHDAEGTPTVSNSLIGDNSASGLKEAQSFDTDGNLIGDPGGGGIIDPRLGPLGRNGGSTQTHALLPGSPAINQGHAHGQTTDQRGAPSSEGVDMGAFELQLDNFFLVNSASNTSDANVGDGICNDGGGNCTLRAAIEEANVLPNVDPNAPDIIFFDIAGAGPHAIQPSAGNPLPDLRDAVIIDGTSEPDSDAGVGNPVVEIDGSLAGAGASGLTVGNGADGSTIRGLAINRFDGNGIFVSRRDNVSIEGNYLGTDSTGTMNLGNQFGIRILNGEDNSVRGNLISGNATGVLVEGPLSTGNVIAGNLLGTNAAGDAKLSNQVAEVNIDIAGAPNNTVGGPGNGDGNVIANGRVGIHIRGSAATGNLVQGNRIGTNANGTAAIFNNRGIEIKTEATDNTIGGAGNAGNTISGNTKGVLLNSVENNLVHGNKIGTNPAGDAALPNTRGVLISGGSNNQIGNEPNVISGNLREGLRIFKPNSDGNIIRDNFIGTNATGDAAIANRDGVVISPDAGTNNTIGGTSEVERNVISGNTRAGVVLLANGNEVTGNFIGIDLSGTAPVSNETGVLIARGGNNNVIGGPVDSGNGNVISGNAEAGVHITSDDTDGNVITGNLIGTDPSGMTAVGNTHGVLIESPANFVGGPTGNDGNVISGNSQNGVYLSGAAATDNYVETNRIGINIDGTAALANARSGVLIENAMNNTIGGDGTGNSIGGNTQQGIRIAGSAATGNVVQGNSIGLDGLTMTAVGNRDGIRIADSASGNTIGGADGLANEIAQNDRIGIYISDGTANTVTQNSFHDNGGLGISLGALGATPNDAADADSGANNLQNSPVIQKVELVGVNLEVTYLVNSAAGNSNYDAGGLSIEFFIADSDDEEGQTFLSQVFYDDPTNVVTLTIPAGSAGLGTKIVATATDDDGNTSEFSAAVAVDEQAADSLFEDLGS